MSTNRESHIRLTSHPGHRAPGRFPIKWGAASARERGPIIGTVSSPGERNAIGAHGGSYALYRALAVSSGALDPIRRPDLTNTHPAETIGPFAQWCDPRRIVSLDPWGHLAADSFKSEIADGTDIRPSIAVTKARLDLHEMQDAVRIVGLDEIKAEDWTLNISRYVLPLLQEDIPPLPEAIAAFKEALTRCREAEDRLAKVMTEGGWLQ